MGNSCGVPEEMVVSSRTNSTSGKRRKRESTKGFEDFEEYGSKLFN